MRDFANHSGVCYRRAGLGDDDVDDFVGDYDDFFHARPISGTMSVILLYFPL